MDEHILQSLDFPDCKVVLFDWSSNNEHRFENLVCLNDDGSLRWKAALPPSSGSDRFVWVALDDGQFRANTMSCFALARSFDWTRVEDDIHKVTVSKLMQQKSGLAT